MAVSISCPCGAFLEIDEKFAGQVIQCPDCEKPLQVPGKEQIPLRTSGFALASVILALTGAFTIIGTVAAVVCGVLGLLSISREPERLAGEKYAVTGMVLGVVFTLLTFVALSSVELFGLESLLREQQWAGKLDYSAGKTIHRKHYSIRRPSGWGVYRNQQRQGIDANINLMPLSQDSELILVNVGMDAHVVCVSRPVNPGIDSKSLQQAAVQSFRESELLRILNREPANLLPVKAYQLKLLTRNDQLDVYECMLDYSVHGRERRCVMRIHYPKEQNLLFAVVGGTKQSQYDHYEDAIRKVVEGFHLE